MKQQANDDLAVFVGIAPGLRLTSVVALVNRRIIYRATIRVPNAWTDDEKRARICRDVLNAIGKIDHPLPKKLWVSDCAPLSGKARATHAARNSLLVGQILGTLETLQLAPVLLPSPRRIVPKLRGLELTNEQEATAAGVAYYGRAQSARKETAA